MSTLKSSTDLGLCLKCKTGMDTHRFFNKLNLETGNIDTVRGSANPEGTVPVRKY
jgi:hypothetical protein